ncbi:hypothetical protein Z947_250 [Sulfitobacter geojensis]|nr:hypothetical protein Z947_250 [Sulfitobacter geojensis]
MIVASSETTAMPGLLTGIATGTDTGIDTSAQFALSCQYFDVDFAIQMREQRLGSCW